MLKTEQLGIGYQGRALQQDLNLAVRDGEMLCLLGRNGTGKSTLLKTLAGLLQPLAGAVSCDDIDIQNCSATQRAKLISIVLTERLSVENTTVEDVVALGRYPYTSMLGNLTKEDMRIIDEALADVQMTEYKKRFFNELSDGEKQRVLIAKTIAQQTTTILLDEPTAHLDLPNRINTMLLLEIGRAHV